jgi:hypothetical protein
MLSIGQQLSVPSILTPQACVLPALTWVKNPAGGRRSVGSQHEIVSFVLIAQTFPAKTLTDL